LSTLSPSRNIRINVYKNGEISVVTANGVPFAVDDITVSNGVLDVTPQVLVPPTTFIAQGVSANFSTFAALVYSIPATYTVLSSYGNWTAFAPSDQAFQSLSTFVTNILNWDHGLVEQVINYHIIASTLYTAGVFDNSTTTYSTLDTSSITVVGSKGTIQVNGANVLSNLRDQTQLNGAIQGIDTGTFGTVIGSNLM
jgi:hypothetical protein